MSSCHYCLARLRAGGLQCDDCAQRQDDENEAASAILLGRPKDIEHVLSRMIDDLRKGDQTKRPASDIAFLIAARDQVRKANRAEAQETTVA